MRQSAAGFLFYRIRIWILYNVPKEGFIIIDFENCVFKLRKVNETSVANDISPLFVTGEALIGVYKGIRDYVVFTNKRMIVVNVQGMTGKKKDFTSLPYSKVQVFSVETSGYFDLDSELEIYFSGLGKVLLEFTGSSDIVAIGKVIGEYVL